MKIGAPPNSATTSPTPRVMRRRRAGARASRCRKASAALRLVGRQSIYSVRSYERGIMKIALLNPNWSFDGSIYFGCREPHLPLELGYAQALLQQAGHEAVLRDAAMQGWDLDETYRRIAGFRPDYTVIATAPSYLFWRCPPPELRVPQQAARALRE